MLGVTGKLPSASEIGLPQPNLVAYWEIVASPMEAPSWAIGILQLNRMAVAIVAVGPGPQVAPPELWMKVLDKGSWSAAGFGNAVSGVAFPLSIAAAASSGLKTEPG